MQGPTAILGGKVIKIYGTNVVCNKYNNKNSKSHPQEHAVFHPVWGQAIRSEGRKSPN